VFHPYLAGINGTTGGLTRKKKGAKQNEKKSGLWYLHRLKRLISAIKEKYITEILINKKAS
jgi:hypothetical protein